MTGKENDMTSIGLGHPVKITQLVPIAAATVVAAVALAAPAHACGNPGPGLQTFQTPSGNIACVYQMGMGDDPDKGYVSCEVRDHVWVADRTTDCTGRFADEQQALGIEPDGDSFSITQGEPATLKCYWGAGNFGLPNTSTLDYGQSLTVGAITCGSEPAGVTCTDSSTGHFFRVSRESYELG
jgi:hypothetical protein